MADVVASEDGWMLVERMRSEAEHRSTWERRYARTGGAEGAFDAAYERLRAAEAAWDIHAGRETATELWTARADLAVADHERSTALARALGPPHPGGLPAFERQAAWARLIGVSAATVQAHREFYDQFVKAAQLAASETDGQGETSRRRRHAIAGAVDQAMRAAFARMRAGREPPSSHGALVFAFKLNRLLRRDADERASDFVSVVEERDAQTLVWRRKRQEAMAELPEGPIEDPAPPSPAQPEARFAIAFALDHTLATSPDVLAPGTLIGRTKVDPSVVVEAARIWIRHEDVLWGRAAMHGRAGPGREALRLADPASFGRAAPGDTGGADKRVERVLPAVARAVVIATRAAQDLADPDDLLTVLYRSEEYFSMAVLEALGPFLRGGRAVQQRVAGLDLATACLVAILDLADSQRLPPGGPSWVAARWQDFVGSSKKTRRNEGNQDGPVVVALERFEPQLDRLRHWLVLTLGAYLAHFLTIEDLKLVEQAIRLAEKVRAQLDGPLPDLAGFAEHLAQTVRSLETHAAALSRKGNLA